MGLFPYIGGDTNIAKFIVSLLPKGEIFIEPFGGAGSVAIEVVKKKLYERVILNDKDECIYAIYYVLKNHPELFPTICDMICFFNNKDNLRKYKSFFRQIIDEIKNNKIKNFEELGSLAILLHLSINVPFASGLPLRGTVNRACLRDVNICINYLREKHEVLRNIEIMNIDALELIKQYDEPSVVMYLDPPHLGLEYYRLNFTVEDAIKLAKTLRELEHARVLLKISKDDLWVYKNILDTWSVLEKEYVVQTGRLKQRNKKRTKYYFMMNYKRSSLLDWL